MSALGGRVDIKPWPRQFPHHPHFLSNPAVDPALTTTVDIRGGFWGVGEMRLVVTICAALSLAGCLSTQEMPLAPNVVRIDTQSKGLLFTGQTVPQTMRTAAKATLDRGYSHFKFTDASLQQGSVVAGTVGSSSTNVVGSSATTVNGSYGGGFMSANAATTGTANATTFGSTSVIRAPTAGAAATVIMFHANDPGAQGAFDAEQVLKQYSW